MKTIYRATFNRAWPNKTIRKSSSALWFVVFSKTCFENIEHTVIKTNVTPSSSKYLGWAGKHTDLFDLKYTLMQWCIKGFPKTIGYFFLNCSLERVTTLRSFTHWGKRSSLEGSRRHTFLFICVYIYLHAILPPFSEIRRIKKTILSKIKYLVSLR